MKIKYQKEFCKRIVDYFSVTPTIKEEYKYINKRGEERSTMRTVPNPNPPTFPGFFASIGALEEDIEDWKDKHAEFRDSYKMAKLLFEDYVQKSAMLGILNSTVFGIVARNKLGWREELPGESGEGVMIYLPAKKGAKNGLETTAKTRTIPSELSG